MRYHVVTLGCDKNTVDSERYVAELAAHGASPAASATEAELIVINTCGFIDAAKQESIDAIVEAARLKVTGNCQMVAAVGCMVQRHKPELLEALPEVDLFLGTTETDRLIAEVGARGLLPDAPSLIHPGVRLYTGDLPHVRYLKISEGCDHGCAFCAIPLMRGKHRSFGLEDLVREAQLLEAQGAREVNLVAQDLAHYGRDVRDGRALPELLRALLEGTDIPWFRLLYIYSAGLTDPMLDLMVSEPRLVPYLDIPMQHAADAVLTRMRRPERRATQLARIARLRDRVPGVAIRSTVIVGFPGETDDEFSELLEFLEEVQLERVGAFTYSPQEGTRAWAMEDDVPDDVKRDRLEQVQQLQRAITAERYGAMLGREVPAIVDRAATGDAPAQARTQAQADDIDGVTWLEGEGVPGSLVSVRLDDVVDDHDFRATVVRTLSAPPRNHATRRALPVAGVRGPAAFGRPFGA
ncbi:MAG: 30S ribosomal protein S12 methylthiotransferase RimO [Gemmatimonadaceae bacterium]|nr:30S ribosomal protein S12 methylthiotransferase RimO [Gemmatimonadaceae bacterium]